jgi:hypothetical protein
VTPDAPHLWAGRGHARAKLAASPRDGGADPKAGSRLSSSRLTVQARMWHLALVRKTPGRFY